jgi:hypothetical protein
MYITTQLRSGFVSSGTEFSFTPRLQDFCFRRQSSQSSTDSIVIRLIGLKKVPRILLREFITEISLAIRLRGIFFRGI